MEGDYTPPLGCLKLQGEPDPASAVKQMPISSTNEVVVTYSGVHQAFQLAQAAQEAGLLERFYCSLFDAPGKWGGRLSTILGPDVLANRRADGLAAEGVVEFPWFELDFKLRRRFLCARENAWIGAAHRFDAWVARQLRCSEARLLIGVENCAFRSFQVARDKGMKLVYDCPGYNARYTQAAAEQTAQQYALPMVTVSDTPEMEQRKAAEMALADLVLCSSPVHAASLKTLGVPQGKVSIHPLWVEPARWYPPKEVKNVEPKLHVLYSGGITIRKGIPYLLEAVRKMAGLVDLTLVGLLGEDVRPLLEPAPEGVSLHLPVPRPELRAVYWRHDVLVLPSLGDSFGFVALEAMACGLPIIVTENCGVPVPDDSWRVPIMDANAIAARLQHYANNRELLHSDGERATAFARQYTPERYRTGIRKLLGQLLMDPSPCTNSPVLS